jgi:hypothetical protein
MDAKEVLSEYEKLLNYWVDAAVSYITGWLRRPDRPAATAEASS